MIYETTTPGPWCFGILSRPLMVLAVRRYEAFLCPSWKPDVSTLILCLRGCGTAVSTWYSKLIFLLVGARFWSMPDEKNNLRRDIFVSNRYIVYDECWLPDFAEEAHVLIKLSCNTNACWELGIDLTRAGSDLKPDCSSELGITKKKKNRLRGSLLNGQIRRLKKCPQMKKFPFGNFFFSRRIAELFFSRTWRQSLPLGRIRGGRSTQKVVQTKTRARNRE